MKRSIYLEGELALKFGAQHSFYGDSVKDALRLLDANKPGLKKYFIDAAECDIGFHIEVGGQELDSPLECLLPLREGDIIITPIAAGSKSGGAKILTAALIAAILFIPTGGMSLYTYMTSVTTSWVPATLANAALALATNLAITGIQQLMAPDPAVDQEDEGYLFNGAEQNIVEGMPIPLLYGELRVPGYPVSFEMIHGSKRITSSDNTITYNGEIINLPKGDIEGYFEDQMERNGGNISQVIDPITGVTASRNSQDILFTDIISEGPIYGLVDGGTSVFLNDDPAQVTAQSFVRLSETPVEFDFTLNSTSVTIDRNGHTKDIEADTENGTKFIIVRNYGSSSASVVRSSVTGSANSVTITSSTGIFTAAMEYDRTNFAQVAIIRLLDSNSSTVFEGYVESYTSSTVAKCIPLPGMDLNPALSNGTYTVVVDGKFQVSSISSNTLTLASNFPGNTGSYKCDLSGTSYETVSLIDRVSSGSKHNSFDVQFRNGNLIQPAFSDAAGTGVGSIALGPGGSFSPFSPVLYADTGETDNPTVEYTGTSASGFGLTTAQAEEVDEVRVTFTYGQLWNRNEKGEQTAATVRYNMYVAVERDGAFGAYQNITQNVEHLAQSNAPRIFEEIIDMRQYQPFTDFKVKITRTTNNDQAYNAGTNTVNTNYTTQSDGSITSLNSIIKENLSYPLTAMAKVRINSKDFQNVPTRTYHCKGIKVKVPSNYVTRDEGVNSTATYNRNVSTGAITSSYQDWDGNFRADKVYTNNPAWVFYDILTNNRYGLGDWLNEDEIDKYALYRIARYCDELVPDGAGGFEPRFTTNVYFTQASDAYKIVKDLATVFRSMIYWMDGEVYTVTDQPGDPIYNFSKSNVIDGAFGYETTGSKTRANQIVVTWNNPAANYKLENLIVEDRDNIINTGRIISEEAVAFGATTEGQALRYGRWKLWTAVNQTELVSFKTAINAAFIAPGDIINVQDSDRYPGNLKYSGRVSNTGTRNTTTIPLDREIELNSGSDYELSVLFTDSVATLAQESATIGTVSYSRGDVIEGATIDTENEASNILDDSGDYVDVTWKPYTNVETQTVSTASGTGITSLTVSGAFSTTPSAESVWVLKESISGVEVEGSKKMYKILSISEESKNIYGITAVEFYNEKYAAVDDNFVLSTQDPVFSPPDSTESIPAPRNAYVIISDLNSGQLKDDVILSWDNPLDSNGNVYDYIDYFEVSGNIPGFPTTLKVSRNQTSLSGLDLPIGTFTLAVRTVAQNGRRSDTTKTTFTIEDPARQAVPRVFGMALGGVLSSPAFVTSVGTFTLEDKAYSLSPIGNPQLVRTFDGIPVTEYTQDCSTIPSLDFSTFTNDEAELASHYIMIDGDDTDPLKLIKYYKDQDLGYGYFYNAGTGNTTHTSNWTSIGTVSVSADSNKVTGSGFDTSLQVGDIIKFSSTQAAKVVYIASATDVRIDKSFSTAISSVEAYRNEFRFNKNDDSVIYSVRNDSGTFKAYPINLAINPDLGKSPRNVILTVNPTFLNFDGDEVLTTNYTNLILTATAFGYKNPVFKFTGTGFDNSEISQTADTVFSAGTNFVATKTLDKVDEYSLTDLVFSVTVAEELDESNTNKQSTADITIPFVKDGAAGGAGKLVRLTSNDYSVVYDDTGANPSPSGTLTFTATASNFTDPYFKFTGDGITDETSYTDGTGDSDTFSYTIPSLSSGWAGNPLSIRVGVAEAAAPTTEIAFDTISIFYVADGVDGDDGIDGYTVVMTNAAHSFTADSSGTVSTYSESGTSIEVYKGGVELNSVTGTPAAGQFSVSVSASNITAGTTSVTGNPFTIGDHSNMTADTALITYTLNIENLVTGTQKQTFSKSSAGTNGLPGATGANGLRRAEGYLYYQSAGTPATTPSGIYTWSTGAVSGTNIGTGSTQWNTIPPEMGAGTSAQYYVRRWKALETTANSTSTGLSIDSATLGHNFAGVVTFSSGTGTGGSNELEYNGATVTQIDGGFIQTNTLTVDKIKSGVRTVETDYSFGLSTTGIAVESTNYTTAGLFTTTDTTNSTALVAISTAGTSSTSAAAFASTSGIVASFYKNSTASWADNNDMVVKIGEGTSAFLVRQNGLPTLEVATGGQIYIGGGSFYDGTTLTKTTSHFRGTARVDGIFDTYSTTNFAGGYGSSGVTISDTGSGSFNGNLIVDGSITAGSFNPTSLNVGGGYGSSGVTLSSTGSGSFDGNVIVKGTFSSGSTSTFAGGYGSSGVTISSTGSGSFNGSLTVDGSAYFGGGYNDTGITLQSDGTGLFALNLVVGGAITAGGNITAYSDVKLKQNLEVIPNALEKVSALTGYTFDRIDTGESQTGLIAQDVLKILPEAVGHTEDGTLTLAYGNLVGLLIEAIKELKAEVEELKNDSSN